ncbi:hypothetical protein HYQ44_015346 [Verticillium longisporum]|nr:hypothetical protein HYQ44_015346 [Verticillium longisporum]
MLALQISFVIGCFTSWQAATPTNIPTYLGLDLAYYNKARAGRLSQTCKSMPITIRPTSRTPPMTWG